MTRKKRTKKERRHSGRVTTEVYNSKEHPYEEVYWNDWIDHRDGWRGYGDKTKIRYAHMNFAENFEVKKYNKKNKRLVRRRKARRKIT